MSDPKVCQNPACRDDQPELFSWLGSGYCSWDCRWAHRRVLADAAVARIDEATSETPSSLPLPAEPDPPGVSGSIGPPVPQIGIVAAAVLWGGSEVDMTAAADAASRTPICREGCACHPAPIVHPAGVIPPETEARVTEQIQTSRLSDAIADMMRESGVFRRAIRRVFG